MLTPQHIASKLKEIKPYLIEKFKVKEIRYLGRVLGERIWEEDRFSNEVGSAEAIERANSTNC